ncbi:disintegrin and metalloproteinase domain-containing protein 10 isoform X2 [Bradysia coprophila]|uniref:disintegrin and metalloproteinase domain-containing protein 10 isoform X2 n=1 Tax=Bradysia coprophila TaxID=38358 RepID=UPI00187DD909|nr:disintegrin and metalloproteinase domain-containing protein 10 isoform X2 [Bradysia coprophila]XP_037032345.1 disintegrin and metalloproteinase domain-containing protein 10 isoform X2 [Bradysia coprophila]
MKMIPCGLILFVLLALPYIESGYVKESGGKRLNEYISHYETLSYDERHIHASHNRAKRSVTKDPHVFLKFKAHGRNFHIRLKRDISTFSDSLVIDSPKGVISVDSSHIYRGEVLGEPDSLVFGSIHDGVFEGKIITDRDAYYVENAKHYFPNRTHLDHGFHSVIYNENHVEDAYAHKREGHVGGCGINEEVSQWMDNIQNSAVDEPPPKRHNSSSHQTKPGNVHHNSLFNQEFRLPHEKYSRDANWRDRSNAGSDDDWHAQSHERVRRATRPKEENKNTCSLYIQTDPLIWRHIREGIADHDRGRKSEIDEKTREEILSLIAHHVTAVNYIYRNTKFDGRVEHRNIRFEVQRIKIDDDSACSESYNGDLNPFCMENIDVSNFLNLHSLSNHEFFCLAYVFTYRDFTGGTLGLAWVASASGASGGICEKYKTYTETVGGLYQSTKRSLNTGIITFVNYNSRVPPKVSQLTLAHEIGHNFGSPHDYPQECRPGGLSGNYIMFASATSGDRPNNSKFSTCSIRNISNVLDAIEDSKKRNCFLMSEGAFCGNKIVEVGEECDCGFNDEECQDKCCYPRQINENDISVNLTARGCTRRARTQCSPSQGPCCLSETCTFVPAEFRTKCKEPTECSKSSTCNGTTPECPEPEPRDDLTKCNNGTQLCSKGECTGSICLLWNMTECFLTSQIIPNINKRKLCELACQDGNNSNTCRSTSEFGLQVGLPEEGISLRPGSPCDNFQGYCDVFLKCRAVDAEGPLVKLKNLLFNKQTLITITQWVMENWYFVVLLGIAFVIFMGMFIKCCAVHTPSSNPKLKKPRRISETLRRPMHTLRRMRHHGNRGAGPRSIPPPPHERGGRVVEGRGAASASAATPSGREPRRQPRPSSSSRGPTHHGHRATSKL